MSNATTKTATEGGVIGELTRAYGLSREQLRNLMSVERQGWLLDAIESGTLGAVAIAMAFVGDCEAEGDLSYCDESDEDIELLDDIEDDLED